MYTRALNNAHRLPGAQEPFWMAAYSDTFYHIGLAALHAGQSEPDLREMATLLDNETALEELFEAAAARTAGTRDEQNGRKSLEWLHEVWRGIGPELQEAIREGIREGAGTKGPARGQRHDGQRRERANKPRAERARNATAATSGDEEGGRPRTENRELTRARHELIDAIEKTISAAGALGIVTATEIERYADEIRGWRRSIDHGT